MEKGIAGREERYDLIDDGFTLVKKVLTRQMIARLRSSTDQVLDAYSDDEKAASGNQGSIVAMAYQDPVLQDLIAWPGSLRALRDLEFDRPRYWSAFIISKEPGAPLTYWHQDWPFWEEDVGYESAPGQLFPMFCLVDTSPENGCLRVIPGYHRRYHPIHDHIGAGHEDDTRHQDPESSPAYADYPDQLDVSVVAGDLVVGDARLLHATKANRTEDRRTVITMWYVPRYDELNERLRAAYQSRLFVPHPNHCRQSN